MGSRCSRFASNARAIVADARPNGANTGPATGGQQRAHGAGHSRHARSLGNPA